MLQGIGEQSGYLAAQGIQGLALRRVVGRNEQAVQCAAEVACFLEYPVQRGTVAVGRALAADVGVAFDVQRFEKSGAIAVEGKLVAGRAVDHQHGLIEHPGHGVGG